MGSPLYLRREPTTDPLMLERYAHLPAQGKLDVVAYKDAACSKRVARWPWHIKSRPDRRFKRITLNCVSRPVVWLPDGRAPVSE